MWIFPFWEAWTLLQFIHPTPPQSSDTEENLNRQIPPHTLTIRSQPRSLSRWWCTRKTWSSVVSDRPGRPSRPDRLMTPTGSRTALLVTADGQDDDSIRDEKLDIIFFTFNDNTLKKLVIILDFSSKNIRHPVAYLNNDSDQNWFVALRKMIRSTSITHIRRVWINKFIPPDHKHTKDSKWNNTQYRRREPTGPHFPRHNLERKYRLKFDLWVGLIRNMGLSKNRHRILLGRSRPSLWRFLFRRDRVSSQNRSSRWPTRNAWYFVTSRILFVTLGVNDFNVGCVMWCVCPFRNDDVCDGCLSLRLSAGGFLPFVLWTSCVRLSWTSVCRLWPNFYDFWFRCLISIWYNLKEMWKTCVYEQYDSIFSYGGCNQIIIFWIGCDEL